MAKKLIRIILVLCAPLIVISCTSTKNITKYNINAHVDVPQNVTIKYSDTKIVPIESQKRFNNYKDLTCDVDSITTYTYEDNLFNITWFLCAKAYIFTLENKSDQTIKINWDDIAYVDPTGSVSRMIHDGIPLENYSHPQTHTNIPRRAHYTDYLIPTSSIIPIVEDDEVIWVIKQLYYFNDTNQLLMQRGTTTAIQIPIVIQDVQNNYVFHFDIESVETRKIKQFSLGKTLGLFIPITNLLIATGLSFYLHN